MMKSLLGTVSLWKTPLLMCGVAFFMFGCQGCQVSGPELDESMMSDNDNAVAVESKDPMTSFASILNLTPGTQSYSIQKNNGKVGEDQEKLQAPTQDQDFWVRSYPDRKITHHITQAENGLYMKRVIDRSGMMATRVEFADGLIMCPAEMEIGQSIKQETSFTVVNENRRSWQLDAGQVNVELKYLGQFESKKDGADALVYRFEYTMLMKGKQTNINSRSILEFYEDGSLARERNQTKAKVWMTSRDEYLVRMADNWTANGAQPVN